MIARRTIAWAILGAIAPSTAHAQSEEVICDPENPSCAASVDTPSPGASLAPPRADQFLDPSNAFEDEPEPRARYVVRWGTTLSVDTHWQPIEREEDIVEWGSGIDAEIGYELPDGSFRAQLRAQLRHWLGGRENPRQRDVLVNASGSRAEVEARLGESFLAWRRDACTLRVGHVITRWGATDLTRPIDAAINPQDTRRFGWVGPAAGDGLLPQPTISAGISGDDLSLQVLLVPFFIKDKVTVFGRDWAIAGSNSPLASSFPVAGLIGQLIDPSSWEKAQGLVWRPGYPDEDLTNMSAGARLGGTWQHTDWGISYFYAWDRTPFVEVSPAAAQLATLVSEDPEFLNDLDILGFFSRNPDAAPLVRQLSEARARGDSIIAQRSTRRHVIAAEGARYIGPIGVRADVVFSPAQNFVTTALTTIRRPTLSTSVGGSWERAWEGHTVVLSSEGFVVDPLDREARLTSWFVPEQERGAEGERAAIVGERLWGVAGAARWVASAGATLEGWSAQAGGVWNGSTRDWIANGSLGYAVTDGVRATLGAVVYEGPPVEGVLTLGGLFDPNDQIYLGMDGAF